MRTMASLESNFNINAISPQGARGLMQFMPATGRQYGITDENWRDPRAQVDASARYYKSLLDEFEGNSEHALAAYNMGPARFRELGMRYDALPETKAHVERYRERYGPVDERPSSQYNVGEHDRNILRSLIQRDDPTGGTPIQAPVKGHWYFDNDRPVDRGGEAASVVSGRPDAQRAGGLWSALFPLGEGDDTGGYDPRGSGIEEPVGDLWDALFPGAGADGGPVGADRGAVSADLPDKAPYRNPFPKGSRAYFEHVYAAGGLPATDDPLGRRVAALTDDQLARVLEILNETTRAAH